MKITEEREFHELLNKIGCPGNGSPVERLEKFAAPNSIENADKRVTMALEKLADEAVRIIPYVDDYDTDPLVAAIDHADVIVSVSATPLEASIEKAHAVLAELTGLTDKSRFTELFRAGWDAMGLDIQKAAAMFGTSQPSARRWYEGRVVPPAKTIVLQILFEELTKYVSAADTISP